MDTTKHDELRDQIRTVYAQVAKTEGACGPGCCGPQIRGESTTMGYSSSELASVPEGADLGLGCGNPHGIAALSGGETVLDLGSGGGLDCFLAAQRVGANGKVIGVDMTPAMVTKARGNAVKVGAANVEFRLGEIERLPVADLSVDVILSNCVINLSLDKPAVFREAFRVLKPGGRLAISDVVSVREMPAALLESLQAYTGCISGSAPVATLEAWLREAGFQDVRIEPKPGSGAILSRCMPGAEAYVASATIEATKPGGKGCCAPTCCA